MTGIAKLIGVACVGLSFGLASMAPASPIGTPAANRIPTGKPHSVNGLFDDLIGSDHEDRAAGDASSGKGGKTETRHRHLTAAEWRQAYIAKHGHDLPSLAHPGH
jgi:hypothetical protein